jgi:hypothetical protein
MSDQRSPASLLLYEEATSLIESIADRRLRSFVEYGLTNVLVRRGMKPGIKPQSDFDLRYFAEALRAIGENRTDLLRILRGDISAIEWWPEEDG